MLLLCVVAVASMSSPALAAVESPVVITETGQLRGTSKEGVNVFLGIPYAAAPVGPLRWRAPAPATSWDGVRNAIGFSASCPQALDISTQLAPIGPTSEDCLYLNVWAPAGLHANETVPVMLWVHGGGFIAGSASQAVYDGTAYAKRHVVLVTINYRIGRLGFFAHPALQAEGSGEFSGNFGLLDVLAALRWVQRNIAAFGGDRANVTLFGESAGAIATNALLTSPAANGLVHKAIVQSGAFLDPTRPMRGESAGGPSSAEHAGTEFAKRMGIPGNDSAAAAALRALPVERVAPSAPQMTEILEILHAAGPMIDGKLIPSDIALAFAAGRHARVPYLIGSTSLESRIWYFADDGAVQTIPIAPVDPGRLLAGAGEDGVGVGSLYLADRMHDAGADIYVFRFSAVPTPLRGIVDGAPHGTDVPYTFDTLASLRNVGGRMTRDDHRLAETIVEYWTVFARTGGTKVAGMPEWPRYSPSGRMVLELASEGPVSRTSAVPQPFVRSFEAAVQARRQTSVVH